MLNNQDIKGDGGQVKKILYTLGFGNEKQDLRPKQRYRKIQSKNHSSKREFLSNISSKIVKLHKIIIRRCDCLEHDGLLRPSCR
jgi:hypothetical protein